jgi:hypothetical protein
VHREGVTVSTRTLAPYVALAALLPLLLLLAPGHLAALRGRRRQPAEPGTAPSWLDHQASSSQLVAGAK